VLIYPGVELQPSGLVSAMLNFFPTVFSTKMG